jgi:hypothetical protein
MTARLSRPISCKVLQMGNVSAHVPRKIPRGSVAVHVLQKVKASSRRLWFQDHRRDSYANFLVTPSNAFVHNVPSLNLSGLSQELLISRPFLMIGQNHCSTNLC